MKKSHKKKSRAGVLFVAGCWIIIGFIALGYFTSEKQAERTKPAEAPAPQTTAPETKNVKSRDLTDKDRKIIGECARHLKTLENLFLEFKNTETFREYGFAHPDYKEWQNTLEKVQNTLDKATEGYFILEYADVYAAACWLHSTATGAAMAAVTGRKKPNHDEKEREYLKMIDDNLEPYLEW